jgi:hypothetical protein
VEDADRAIAGDQSSHQRRGQVDAVPGVGDGRAINRVLGTPFRRFELGL